MQLYKALQELSRVKGFAENPDVYAIMLGFYGDKKLYASGTVIALDQEIPALVDASRIELTSVAELLHLQGLTSIMVNKPFLICTEAYTGSTTMGPERGVAMVLIDPGRMEDQVDALMGPMGFLEIRNGARAVYTAGEPDPALEVIQIDSLVSPRLSYRMQVSRQTVQAPLPAGALIPVAALALAGIVFIWIMYAFLRARYHPIGQITRLVRSEEAGDARRDDLETVMQGITSLIGQRNGYRERMITISPYASHGALHQLLSGNLGDGEIQVLQEERFLGLKKEYFTVGLLNLALARGSAATESRFLDARSLAARAAEELSDEEWIVVTCPKDAQNLYVVVNGDDPNRSAEFFYRLLPAVEEALDDPALAVTLGVSRSETELDRLRPACLEAAAALENMMIGGRGSVYFYEEETREESREYFFPPDAQSRILRDLQEGQEQDLRQMMSELWDRNFVKASLTPEAARQLVDELHTCVSGALRQAGEKSVTHIRVQRIREPATIEEVFAYYQSTLTEAMKTCRQIRTEEEDGERLEQAICDYVTKNALDPSLSLTVVADTFGVSGKMVGNACKAHLGKNYLQALHDLRIQESVRLLQETDLPLEEIAEKCGFTNVLTFRRNFKAAMNKNPSDYRK